MFTKHIRALRSELEFGVTAYATSLVLMAGGAACGLIATGTTLHSLWSVGILSVAAALSERGRVQLTSTTEESISLLPTLFAAILFGPLAGMAVGAASLLGEFGQPPYLKWVTYTSSRAIVGAVTGATASFLVGLPRSDVAGIALATTGGAVISETLDVFFAAVAARLRGTRSPWELVRTLAPLIASSVPLYAPVVTLLAI